MKTRLLKAWIFGWAISLCGLALNVLVHSPLDLMGTVILAPGLPGTTLLIFIGRKLGMSDAAMVTAGYVSTTFFASLIYGALIFVRMRAREKRETVGASKAAQAPDSGPRN